ncbi:Arabinose efflux permease-like protein [candidate division TM7 genomosp. GTL1]|nr:Arabinose efflux permease-like protein [candidate division TM7 genomosp. GTL1]
MGVVLPVIQRELGMGAQSLQWIVSGYVLGYGGFLLLGGRVADLFGRRRVFLISMLVFGLASLAGGLATEGWMLIAARIVKGICAGFTGPAALSLLLGLFQDPAKRNAALGTFSSVGALGFALGQVIGGFLGDISWRFTMLLPVPVAFVVVILGMLTLTRDAKNAGCQTIRSGWRGYGHSGASLYSVRGYAGCHFWLDLGCSIRSKYYSELDEW